MGTLPGREITRGVGIEGLTEYLTMIIPILMYLSLSALSGENILIFHRESKIELFFHN